MVFHPGPGLRRWVEVRDRDHLQDAQTHVGGRSGAAGDSAQDLGPKQRLQVLLPPQPPCLGRPFPHL